MLKSMSSVYMRGLLVAVLVVVPFSGGVALARSLPEVSPEKAGFSAERLELVDRLLEDVVERGEFAGASMVVARHGKLVYQKSVGERDLAAGKPMTEDTIVRIYSMSKPITGVAMMILFEEGKWQLDDPVSKYIPEFADMKVYAGENEDGSMKLVEPDHPMTMRELMSHSGGLTYGVFGSTPVDKMYQEDNPLAADDLQGMIDRLAEIPLLAQPGDQWIYSVSVDVQGYLVEKLSGQSFPDFLEERIFEPLGMDDTAFYVAAGAQDRFSRLYRLAEEGGGLVEVGGQDFGAGDYASMPGLPSGGAGLTSTIGDYLRFSQMMLNGGELDGKRILSPASVNMMRQNHLPEDIKAAPGIGLGEGVGFGLDFAVVTDPVKAGGLYGKGTYYWSGAAGTWFWIDPVYDIVVVGFVQRMMGGPNMHNLSRTAVYQALVNPEK